MLCDQMYQILEQLMFKLHGGNDQASDITAHLVRLIQCWATGDIADFVYAASEHRAGQCAAWEAVDPALDSLLGALEGLRCVLGCGCDQVGLSECVIGIIQRIGAVQYGLQLTAHAVIVDRCCEHQHIGIVHSGDDVHGIIIDYAATELEAGKAALAETNLLFPKISLNSSLVP